MGRRDDTTDLIVRCLDAGRSVVLRAPAGMGKTTTIRDVVERRSVATLHASPSLSAKGIAFGAFAAIVPLPHGDSTSRVSAAISHLRSDGRLLVVDDCQLLDDESATVLHLLASERPLLLAVRVDVSCPDGILRLMSGEFADVVELGSLTMEELTALAEKFVDDPIDRRTLESLMAASEGNPRWAGELLAANQRAGSLRRVEGVWTIDDFVGAMSVRELLRDRVLAWAPAVRRVASMVAVGDRVHADLLVSVCSKTSVYDALLSGAVQRRDDGRIELANPQMSDTLLAMEDPESRTKVLLELVRANDELDRETVTQVAAWLLQLGSFHAADAELLTAAARRTFDGTNPALAQQLVEAAVRAGGGSEARELLVRVQSARGLSTERPIGQRELHADAIGATEAFAYGLRPADGVRGSLLEAMASEDDDDRRLELRVFDLVVGLQVGDPVQPVVDALLAITESGQADEVVRTAAVAAATAMVTVGRYERVRSLCDRMDADFATSNVFQNMSLAVSGAEAMLWAGRMSEAKQRASERLRASNGSDTAVGAVFLGGLEAQVAMAEGNPLLAARILGAVSTGMHGIDASGVLSWTNAYLRWALAWAGQPVDDVSRIVAPPQGQLLGPRIEYFQIMATAELGMIRLARRMALDFAEHAEAIGHYAGAFDAVHLAGRIKVTRDLVGRAGALAANVDGDLAVVIRDHLAALSLAEAAGLEKVAQRFEATGHLALAQEAFANAAKAHTELGIPSAARRCRAEAGRLHSRGVAPTFIARQLVVHADVLTARESEVSVLAATGRSNREVGEVLGLSARTVETHLQHAYGKLGVNDRTQLAERLKASGAE